MDFIVTPALSRAARAILGLTQKQAAAKTKVAFQTLVTFERGTHKPTDTTLEKLKAGYVKLGVHFSANGVSLDERSAA